MSTQFRLCRCGASIPAEWPNCGECQNLWNTLHIEGHELGFRHHAIWQMRKKGALGPDPLPENMVHTVSRAMDKRFQEHAFLAFRAARRQATHDAIVKANKRYREELDR